MLNNISLADVTTVSYSTLNTSSTHLGYIDNSDNYTTDSNTMDATNDWKHHQYIIETLGIIRLCVCLVGIALNVFSIIAILHLRREINNHLKLIISLAVSDTLTLLTVVIFYEILDRSNNPSILHHVLARQFVNTSVMATLTNLLGMAVEHYIAIMIPLRYPMYMTNLRNSCMIVFIWLISLFVGFLDKIILCFTKEDGQSVWEAANTNAFSSEMVVIVFMPVVCVVVTTIYMRIYCVVRSLVKNQPTVRTCETKNYKAVITTFLILGTFILCWLPHFTFQIGLYCIVESNIEFAVAHMDALEITSESVLIGLLLNCVCDPIIYAVRLRQVRLGLEAIFNNICTMFKCLLPGRDFRMLKKAPMGRRSTEATIMNDTNCRNGKDSVTRRSSSYTPNATVYVSEELDLKQNPCTLQGKTNNNTDYAVSGFHEDDPTHEPIHDNQGEPENDKRYQTGNGEMDDIDEPCLTETSSSTIKEFLADI